MQREVFSPRAPHLTSVRASVVGFNLSLVLTIFLFDGFSEGIVGSSSLELGVDVACNSWLLVGKCTYGHCGDDVVDALDEASD